MKIITTTGAIIETANTNAVVKGKDSAFRVYVNGVKIIEIMKSGRDTMGYLADRKKSKYLTDVRKQMEYAVTFGALLIEDAQAIQSQTGIDFGYAIK